MWEQGESNNLRTDQRLPIADFQQRLSLDDIVKEACNLIMMNYKVWFSDIDEGTIELN